VMTVAHSLSSRNDPGNARSGHRREMGPLFPRRRCCATAADTEVSEELCEGGGW